jgi:hypothetical protein
MNNADLWAAFINRMTHLGRVAAAAEQLPEDTDVAWTGRTMQVPWFAEHMREELVLHNWDITGDDAPARQRLAPSWMTNHSVYAVGAPLLRRGREILQLNDNERIEARIRVADTDDVVVTADADTTAITLARPDGTATIETDAATRVLLLVGAPPGRPWPNQQRSRPARTGPAAHIAQRLLTYSSAGTAASMRYGPGVA